MDHTEQNVQTLPKVTEGSYWMHTNGCTYKVLYLANTKNDNIDHPVTVVYQSIGTTKDNSMWTRPLKDWHRSMSILELKIPLVELKRLVMHKKNYSELDLMKYKYRAAWPLPNASDRYRQELLDVMGRLIYVCATTHPIEEDYLRFKKKIQDITKSISLYTEKKEAP